MTLKKIATSPIAGQKPGTSGIRKKVAVFRKGITWRISCSPCSRSCPGGFGGKTLVVGGDGRYYNREAIAVIRIAAANGFGRVAGRRGGHPVDARGILCHPQAQGVRRHHLVGKPQSRR